MKTKKERIKELSEMIFKSDSCDFGVLDYLLKCELIIKNEQKSNGIISI